MIKKYNVKKFTISLDSHIAQKHNSIRGCNGVFEETTSNLSKIKELGCDFFIKATINGENVEDLFGIMLLAEKLGAYGFSYSRTIPIGRAEELRLYPNGFWEKYLAAGIKCSEYAGKTKMRFIIDDPLRHMFDVRSKKFLEENEGKLDKVWGGCTAGLSYLYVLLNGDAIACTALTKPAGNIFEDTIENIWINSELLLNLRNRTTLNGKCGTCSKKYYCGGCRAYAFATTQDERGEDTFCPL